MYIFTQRATLSPGNCFTVYIKPDELNLLSQSTRLPDQSINGI